MKTTALVSMVSLLQLLALSLFLLFLFFLLLLLSLLLLLLYMELRVWGCGVALQKWSAQDVGTHTGCHPHP